LLYSPPVYSFVPAQVVVEAEGAIGIGLDPSSLFGNLDPSILLGNFSQANSTTGAGGFLANCSDIVEYDAQGRATRIERPSSSLFTGSIQEIEYLADKLVRVLVDNNADAEFEEVREYDYSSSGEVVEERITRDGELAFRRDREYISMELPAIP
jgi:hypothetical protein